MGSCETDLTGDKESKLVADFLSKLAVYTSKVITKAGSTLSDSDLDAAYPPGKVAPGLPDLKANSFRVRCSSYFSFGSAG